MSIAVFLAALIVAIAMGIPIAFALLAAGLALMVQLDLFDAQIMAQNLINGADSYALLAIPFFILAGELMNAGGISQRIIDLPMNLVYGVCMFGFACATLRSVQVAVMNWRRGYGSLERPEAADEIEAQRLRDRAVAGGCPGREQEERKQRRGDVRHARRSSAATGTETQRSMLFERTAARSSSTTRATRRTENSGSATADSR